MPPLPWFRMYTEFATDPDVQCLAFEDQRHYVVLLCLKGNGTLDKEYPSTEKRESVIRRVLGLDQYAADECRSRLMEAMLIDERWQPRAWEKRQFDSDLSTGRVRKHREKRQGNVSETPPDTDTEQKEKDPPYPPDLDVSAWERWLDYRKQLRKPIKPVSMPAAQRKLAGHGADQAAVVEQSIANGWQGLFALKDKPNGPNKSKSSAVERAQRATGGGF